MSQYVVEALLRASGVSDFQRAFADAESALGNIDKAADRMQQTGKTLTKAVTVPLMGLGAGVLKVGSEYEASMSQVQAISGASAEEMEMLGESARGMAQDTRYSASEAADALGYMSLAGWDASQSSEALGDVLNLATASGMDLARASDVMTDTMSMFGIEAENSARAADVLAAASSKSNTDVDQLSEAMINAGGTAASYGHEIEQTSAVLGIFADQGLKGSKAGTTLDAMYRDLAGSAENGAVAIGDTSVAVFDAEGNMRSMSEITDDVRRATEGMTDEQRNAALSSVFQQQSLRGVNYLLNAQEGDLEDLEDALYNSAGASQEMADVMDDNVQGAFMGLKSSLEEAMLQFYELGEGPIRNLIQWATDLVDKFTELDSGTQQLIALLAGVAAAAGPLLIIFAQIIKAGTTVSGALTKMTEGMVKLSGGGGIKGVISGLVAKAKALAGVMAPALAVIAVIAALTAAVIYLWRNNEQFRENVITVWNAIKDVFTTVISWISDFIKDVWGALTEWWQENQEQILEVVSKVWNAIYELVSLVVGTIVGFVMEIFGMLVEWWQENNELIMETASTIWNAIYEIIADVVQFIQSLIDAFVTYIVPFLAAAWENIKSVIEIVWSAISMTIQNAIDIVMTVIRTIMQIIQGDWEGAWQSIQDLVSRVWDRMKDHIDTVFSAIGDIISNTLSFIWDLISSIWERIVSYVTERINSMRETISSVLSSISSTFSSIWNAIVSLVSSVWSSIVSTIRNMIQSAFNTISNVLNNIRNTFSNIWNAVRNATTTAFTGVTNAIRNGIRNGLNAITNMFSNFKDAGRKVVTMIADGIRGAISSVTDAIGNVAGAIRDRLPFSPAKEGPLEDLHRLNFGGTIADSIYGGEGDITKAMDNVLHLPDVNQYVNTDFSGTNRTQPIQPEFHLHLGDREYTDFVEDITNEQDRQMHINDSF